MRNKEALMALTQRDVFNCHGRTGRGSHVDSTDCVDDDFETVMERSKHMKSENNRLDTYTNWPLWSNQSPGRLAEAGLYYTGVDDRVQCPFCYGVLKKWDRWDIPLSEHRRHFPYCRFIQGEDVGNVPMDHVTVRSEPAVRSEQVARPEPTLQMQKPTENMDYTKEENRIVTFLRWPLNLSQTPEALAAAGFYHVPTEDKPDRVKCAYCHGKLYNWNRGDDPWIEHARCFPKCPYVKLCVGENIIEDLQQEKTISRRGSERTGVTPNWLNKHSQTSSLPDLMGSEAVQAVLEMGFSQELVQMVMEKYLKDGRGLSISAEDLTSAVLDMEPDVTVSTNHSAQNDDCACARRHEKSRHNDAPVDGKKLASAGTSSNSERLRSIRRENMCLRDQYLCKICMENQVRVTFLPCGHLACCGPCSMCLSDCPVCRSPITGSLRTYF